VRVNRSCRACNKCEVSRGSDRVCGHEQTVHCQTHCVQWRLFTRIVSNTLSNISDHAKDLDLGLPNISR